MGGWMRIEMKRALIKHNYERPGLSQWELAAWAKFTATSREIWDAMQKQRTIRNCFAHTGICFRGVNEESSGNRDESSVEDQLLGLCASHGGFNQCKVAGCKKHVQKYGDYWRQHHERTVGSEVKKLPQA
ncbi:hypothetical protein GQ600_96 [Phytophthora cactorum]|nr:hypothetical protein GQ600_96 [Phytophthora cactorum]